MKSSVAGLLILLFLMPVTGLVSGCGEVPPCETSLVTLDETRLDAETYEKEAAEAARRVVDLERRLAEKNKDIESIKDKPAELKKKVYELKKGSGRD
ncbi:MAG: hypothetical protein B6D63_00070 [Candidatus Latescibacteria bacterium 4484_7]|nr:MAG: hypothetical protein B6D63_00070 [Candidatus Latescibacteria bacterium 4484_7]RKZ06764.1 MAG: hypothetical protein DRQ05_04220 [bacterium]